jgi:ribosomal protein L7/L12
MKFEFDTIEQIIAFADRVRLVEDQKREKWDDEYRAMLMDHRVIDAIKLHRSRTGMGLKEAKDYIESLRGGD